MQEKKSLLYFIRDLALNLRGKDFLMQYMKIALIIERIELESCALAHLKENSKMFKNLSNFIFLSTSNNDLSLFTSVPLFISPLLMSPRSTLCATDFCNPSRTDLLLEISKREKRFTASGICLHSISEAKPRKTEMLSFRSMHYAL